MKGLVEFKNEEGEVKLTCLFGMMAILDFCELKGISFTDFEKAMGDDSDLVSKMRNFMSIIYCAAKNYAVYKKEPFDLTEKQVSLEVDVNGLLNEENIKNMTEALYSGFGKVEKKTQA
jgi:hypothetical protein